MRAGAEPLAGLKPAHLEERVDDGALVRVEIARGHDGEIGSYSDLGRVLDTARAAGFASEDGSVTEGIASVAVVVRDHAG